MPPEVQLQSLASVADVCHGRSETGDQVVDGDKSAQPVLTGAHRNASANDSFVDVDGPRCGASEGSDRAALVSGCLKCNTRFGQLQLVDADDRAQFRPRDLSVARYKGK